MFHRPNLFNLPPPTSCEIRHPRLPPRRSQPPPSFIPIPNHNFTTNMATFRPVNTTLVPETNGRNGEEANPLTPRPNTAPTAQVQQMMRDDATTPTRANFGTLASQRPLPPASPFPATLPSTPHDDAPKQGLNRGDSQYSAKSRDSDDVEMGDSDGEDGSDDDASVNADGTRSSKKKGKAQRFFCTEYPPCNLSFTRSEHLARHIR